MKRLIERAQAVQEDTVNQIRELVEVESPSNDRIAVDRCIDKLIAQTSDIAEPKRMEANGFGGHLLLRLKDVSAPPSRGRILMLGHADTVWPVGTLASMPFRQNGERLLGPGVLDMKAGLVIACQAIRLLRFLDIRVKRELAMLVVSDEEVGSPSSRSLTESLAKESDAVLVLEPGAGLAGALKTARKGVGRYTLQVTGRAAHAGVDFEQGASAVNELARQIVEISRWTDNRRGTTVNVGIVRGGSASNVIAAQAAAEIDVRVVTRKDELRVQRKFHKLRPHDARCELEVAGGPNRPPMERSRGIAKLFKTARKVANSLSIELSEASTGGGSDGNFTAALGVPTLDGLGAVGEGAHAQHESVLIDRIPERVALLAGLLAAL